MELHYSLNSSSISYSFSHLLLQSSCLAVLLLPASSLFSRSSLQDSTLRILWWYRLKIQLVFIMDIPTKTKLHFKFITSFIARKIEVTCFDICGDIDWKFSLYIIDISTKNKLHFIIVKKIEEKWFIFYLRK